MSNFGGVTVKLILKNLALAMLVVLMAAPAALAQVYPKPGKSTNAPVLCADCAGKNSSGQNNKGLKTWPYSSPIVNHTGRIVNSVYTGDIQGSIGTLYFRTARARIVRLARKARGSAPPRAYIQIGSAMAAYSLDRFFTSTLPGPMQSAGELGSYVAASRGSDPVESIAPWDAFVYPESSSPPWAVGSGDGQDRMYDFDFDDRGYVYVAAGGYIGLGIVQDSGATNGGQLPLVGQVAPATLGGIEAANVIALRAGNVYYAVVASSGGRMTFTVTDPANPIAGAKRPANDNDQRVYGILTWAKDDDHQRVAISTIEGKIEIYDNVTFATGGTPLRTLSAPSSKKYGAVTVDDDGNFWTVEMTSAPTNNSIVKLDRATGYTEQRFDVFGGPFTVINTPGSSRNSINYGDHYLTVVGQSTGGIQGTDVRLFKIEAGVPVAVDLGGFFTKYYYAPPRDYAQPRSSDVGTTYGAHPIRWGNKTYLIFNTHGLGDVYELSAGDSIAVTQKAGSFGTLNPNAKSTAAGPFYGDILKFNAKSSNPSFEYDVTWDFDNPDSGAANTAAAKTNQDVAHQYTGLGTAALIQAARKAQATGVINSTMVDSVAVTMAVPTARIGILGTNTALTTDGASLTLIAGDAFTDASDGEIEGHYSHWTVDTATPIMQAPNLTLPVGDVGAHTVTLSARYGKYNTSFTTVGTAYTDAVSTVAYVVRPFAVAFGATTSSGAPVTFTGSARKTSLAAILPAVTWTVDWTLKNGAADVVPPQSSTVAVGQIPSFTVANKGAIPSGSILTLKVSVPLAGLGVGVPTAFAEHSITQTLVTPDPVIHKTGCANVGSPCSLTVSSIGGQPTDGWTVTWSVDGTAGLTAGATEAFKPTLAQGPHTITAAIATNVFAGSASETVQVEPTICGGPPPTKSQLGIYTSCTSCSVNQTVTIRADMLGYTREGCEEYVWAFGDGSQGPNLQSTSHKYTAEGSYTVTLTVKKGAQTSPLFQATVNVGTIIQPPTCTAPSAAISYNGSKGCQPGVSCKTGESISFSASRANGALLQSCDTVTWSFGDSGNSNNRTQNHTYQTANTYTVVLTVTNSVGEASTELSVPVVADTQPPPCDAPPTSSQAYLDFTGVTSGCTKLNEKVCQAGEVIKFKPKPFLGGKIQTCDQFQWSFGDGGSSNETEPQHTFAAGQPSYVVTAKVYNSTNTTGNQLTVTLPFENVPILQVPALSFSAFSATASKGNPVTFTVSSDISAKNWLWNFGDGSDPVQPGTVGTSSTATHTYNAIGPFTVSVSARNSQDTTAKSTSQVSRSITIDETPEYKYLLPVVAHAAGIGSVWRTDVQVYTADSAVSPSNPLTLTASYKGVNYPLSMTKSTLIIADILNELRPGATEQGSMVITVKTQRAPQIWSRTYNQTTEGTFGQFVPAILLNEAGNGGAVGEGKYYLAGLRSNNRYRTNIGLVNPNAQEINAIIRLYDDTGLPVGTATTHTLPPFQLDQFPVTGPADRAFSVEIEVPAGTWVIGYASYIDGGSSDPVYLQAIRQSELGSTDYRDSVVPGVGHVGAWRSDVTIYNPNGRIITVDLAYHNAAGTKIGEAKNIPINAGQFLQYGDVLRQGIFGSVEDGVGMLRVTVPSSVSADFFPMAFARTYNDNGTGKTYGQGIAGFAAARVNVKAGKSALIPAVRSDDKYYTNVGLTNVSNAAVEATVRVLDPNTGAEVRSITYPLKANESIVATQFDLVGRANASLKIEATGSIWAFASIIDKGTFDPEYVPATPLP